MAQITRHNLQYMHKCINVRHTLRVTTTKEVIFKQLLKQGGVVSVVFNFNMFMLSIISIHVLSSSCQILIKSYLLYKLVLLPVQQNYLSFSLYFRPSHTGTNENTQMFFARCVWGWGDNGPQETRVEPSEQME